MKKSLPIYLSATALLLFACGGEPTESSLTTSKTPDDSIVSSSGPLVPSDPDLKETIAYLQAVHDYSIQIEAETSYRLYFAPHYYFLEDGIASIGYVEDEDGIYRLLSDERENLRGSALLNVPSLYGSGLFPSLNDLDMALEGDIGDGTMEYELTNKLNKLAVLAMMELPSSAFLTASSFRLRIDDGVESFRIEVTIEETVHSLAVVSLDGASETVDAYLARGGSYYEVPDDLSSYKDAFAADNYKRDVLDLGDPTVSLGTEHFMPDYWGGLYNDYGHSQGGFDQAFVSFEHVDLAIPTTGEDGTPTTTPHVLNGTYLFILTNSDDGLLVSPSLSYPYITTNDLTEVSSGLGYIKRAMFWDYLEFADPLGDGAYLIDDSVLAIDFDSLNGGQIQSAGYLPRSIEISPRDENGIPYIDFAINFVVPGSQAIAGATYFSFFDFGNANIPEVEKAIVDVLAYQV